MFTSQTSSEYMQDHMHFQQLKQNLHMPIKTILVYVPSLNMIMFGKNRQKNLFA